MTSQTEIQLGKKGITPEFLEGVKKRFDKREIKNLKVHVLQNARESRDDVKKYAEDIQKFLGNKFTHRIVGFSIFFTKWRKARE